MATKRITGVFASWPKPDFAKIKRTAKDFRSNFHGALMYAHYELSAIDLKKESIKFVKAKNPKDVLLERMKDVHENRFATIGKYMYLVNHGVDLPEDIEERVLPTLVKILDEVEEKEALAKKQEEYAKLKAGNGEKIPEPAKMLVSIQDRIKERTREIAGEVEGWIDDFVLDKKSKVKTVEEFVNLFKGNDLKAPHMRFMKASFENRLPEITEAIAGKDKFLNEGYSHFTKPELKKFEQLFINLLAACDMLQEVAKVTRAPRKKKPISQDKMIAKLKYKKEDSSLGIVSINPIQIIGAKEIWTYNTKSRRLAQIKAMDERGLLVKGTSIDNISTNSVEKTLRKPADTLAEFKKASKVKLRTFLSEIKAVDTLPNGRFSEHHIILRVDK